MLHVIGAPLSCQPAAQVQRKHKMKRYAAYRNPVSDEAHALWRGEDLQAFDSMLTCVLFTIETVRYTHGNEYSQSDSHACEAISHVGGFRTGTAWLAPIQQYCRIVSSRLSQTKFVLFMDIMPPRYTTLLHDRRGYARRIKCLKQGSKRECVCCFVLPARSVNLRGSPGLRFLFLPEPHPNTELLRSFCHT